MKYVRLRPTGALSLIVFSHHARMLSMSSLLGFRDLLGRLRTSLSRKCVIVSHLKSLRPDTAYPRVVPLTLDLKVSDHYALQMLRSTSCARWAFKLRVLLSEALERFEQ
eukprot:3795324-Amphidinium_carterae.4